ncbi:transcriptional regulator [Citrobacter amalonaticus]|uniref:winged helix-turn-helix domain-containing protein n=1 Tax=Citrobacter amalonaticus TaxID=35703 RepID=UPI001A182A4D|nr:hypothetical protein [Citrobacter amalonaticus]HDQ2814054.1 winged helix-turn-helix domain-containing protein [Citrobacter amalonaticus]
MAKGYLINYIIEFWPDDNKLVNRQHPDLEAQLTGPASRCFELLLENAPEKVHQDDFFKAVWEKSGMVVPQNTLYQSISIIRKGLKLVNHGKDTDIIKTIPRYGFRVNSDTYIQNIEAPPTYIQFSENKNEELVIPSHEDEVQDGAMPFHTHESLQSERPKIATKKHLITIIISLLTIPLILFFSYLTAPSNNDFFSSYVYFGQKNGCSFFINPDNKIKTHKFDRIKEEQIECKTFPWVYITSYRYTAIVSSISCSTPMNDNKRKPNCISIFIRDIPE